MGKSLNFRSFKTYFAYDVTNYFIKYGRSLLILGLFPVFFHTLYGLLSILFSGHWANPGISMNNFIMVIISGIFIVSMPMVNYGFITDKKRGVNFILLPASTFEKWLSMSILTFILAPFIFLSLYFLSDFLMAKILGTSCLASQHFTNFNLNDNPYIQLYPQKGIFFIYYHIVFGLLFFLLGALWFKKKKVTTTIFLFTIFIISNSFLATVLVKELFTIYWEEFMSGSSLSIILGIAINFYGIVLFISGCLLIYTRLRTIKL